MCNAASIRGRRLLNYPSRMRHLIEGGVYSMKYGNKCRQLILHKELKIFKEELFRFSIGNQHMGQIIYLVNTCFVDPTVITLENSG